jgi:hypothetical protein
VSGAAVILYRHKIVCYEVTLPPVEGPGTVLSLRDQGQMDWRIILAV